MPDVVPPEDQFPQVMVGADRLPGAIARVNGDELRFIMRGATTVVEAVELIPFYQNHFQRYAIYWKMA